MHTLKPLLASVLLAVLTAAPAAAQDAAAPPTPPAASEATAPAQPVAASLQALIVTRDAEGKEAFAPAAAAAPGDTIEYRITYKNQSGGPLTGFAVNGPVPAGTSYVAGTEKASASSAFEVLVDGEDWQKLPAYKTVTAQNGEKSRVEAVPADFRQLRWRLAEGLADGTAVTSTYRVRVGQ